jgi:hypothetical protein
VHTYIEEKEQIDARMIELEEALKQSELDYEGRISDLERKHVQEKDRLKKEMIVKLRETKAKLLEMTDSQVCGGVGKGAGGWTWRVGGGARGAETRAAVCGDATRSLH